MTITSVSVSYSCKFNDPQKRYTNHNYTADATATVEPGEDPEQIRQKLAKDLEAFVHGRRQALYQASELEERFKEQKHQFKYAVDNVRRYEEGTRQAREQMLKANKIYQTMEKLGAKLASLGLTVDLPTPCLDLPAAKPALAPAVDPEEEGNDPDEAIDEGDDD